MTEPTDISRQNGDKYLLQTVVVPVAHKQDAQLTAQVLEPYNPTNVIVVYIVEKGDGSIDKTPVDLSKEVADEAFSAFRETFPDAESKIGYARDVVDEIISIGTTAEATAIAFRPRKGGRLQQFLSGDLTISLINQTPVPVVILPRTDHK